MSLLSRHVVGIYLRAFAMCLVGAISLLLVVEFFSRIGDFAAYNSNPGLVAAYFALRTPKWLVEVYPAASLLAVLLGIGSLVRSNEVLAMLSCGVSVGQIGRPLVGMSILLSVSALAWNEYVVPPAAGRARAIKDIDIKSMDSRGKLDATSLWLQVPEGFLNIDYFDATNNKLEGITLHGVDEHFRLNKLIEIPEAIWRQDHWAYEGGTVREFTSDGGLTYAPLSDPHVDLGGTPAEFRRKAPRSDEFSIRQLRQRIRTLEAKGLDPAGFQTDLQFKFALPLSGIITVLIGLPLALRGSSRTGNAQHIGTGMGVCFLYWLTQALTVSAGHAGSLPPVMAAWAANGIFLLVGGMLALRN
ncbi:MAG TPA: LptF/LptG family permease [Candidatus Limnocylindrales bacterium]|nr:LptF/LptG family permease [Candidatus Limnocylindrales bacterium]